MVMEVVGYGDGSLREAKARGGGIDEIDNLEEVENVDGRAEDDFVIVVDQVDGDACVGPSESQILTS